MIRLKGDSSSLADSSHSSKRTSTARAWRRSQKGAGGPLLTAAQGRLPVAWGPPHVWSPALGSRPPPPPRPEQPAPGLVRARRPGPRPPCLPDRTLAGPAASPARPPLRQLNPASSWPSPRGGSFSRRPEGQLRRPLTVPTDDPACSFPPFQPSPGILSPARARAGLWTAPRCDVTQGHDFRPHRGLGTTATHPRGSRHV